MSRAWQVASEAVGLDDQRETIASTARFAVEHVAHRELCDWGGDSCEYWCQESGKPETRAKYKVTASFSIDLYVREA